MVQEKVKVRWSKIGSVGRSECVLLLDDNAKSHSARDTQNQIRRFGWESLANPIYGPDLARSDIHLFFFPVLKAALSGSHFQNNAEVEQAV